MKNYLNLFDFSQKVNYKTEILSGFTVALALIPEAVAFALIAGLSPLTGLYAAFVMGLVTSIFGGRPGMISGATGAIAVIIIALSKTHGVEYVFSAVILAGVFQFLAGLLKLGKLMRLVPHPAIFGFVNGLAIVIFMSQLDQFKNADGEWLTGTPLYILLGLVLLTMLIIWGLPKLTKAIPASLAAIAVVFAVVVGFGIDTKTVGDIASIKGGFPPFNIPDIQYTWETLELILPYSAIIAGVGLIESLLTLNIVDEITETKGKGNKEAMAQGVANIFSGFFSGMGGCAMLGQSLINISSGARARLSGIVASIMLLLFVLFGSVIIEQLPMAALTGLMIMVAIGTFEWASLNTINKFPIPDIIVMFLVAIVTVFAHNLALAVLIGVIIASLVYAWDNAQRIKARKFIDDKGIKHYEINGPLFFGSTFAFENIFDVPNDPDEVIIDLTDSRISDMSAIEALNKLTIRYNKYDKDVRVTNLSKSSYKKLVKADKLLSIKVLGGPRKPSIVEN